MDTLDRLFGISIFPADLYYLSKIPVSIAPNTILMILLACVITALLASVYPAYKASQLDPVEVLKQ